MRTVVEEPTVTEFIDQKAEQNPRLRDRFRGLKWVLSRNPDHKAAEPVPESEAKFGEQLYLIKTASLNVDDAGPPLRLMYYFDESEVVFWGISFGHT